MINIKNKYFIRLLMMLLISIIIISTSKIINAKYIMQNEFYIANLDIDRTKPKIELVSIINNNEGYENYANKANTIKVTIKIIDENLKEIFCDKEHVKVKIDNKYVQLRNIEFIKIKDSKEEKIYEIQLKNIEQNGKLKIELFEGLAIDKGELKNENKEINTNIIIDNEGPKGEFSQIKIVGGKVKGSIKLNEKIRDIEGWDFSQDKLKLEKEFTNNISYQLPIIDYAGNKSIIEVDITQATYINLIYASHNSEIGWTFGYGNYDVAGSKAIKENPIYKTEALAFNINGNIDPDFVQAQAYIYTHWGVGSFAQCRTSGMLYNYGYNPNNGTYKSMKSDDLVTINNKKYFQFGGSRINAKGNTDINGNGIISEEVNLKYPYGISGIKIKLKDYSQFSVVYQILVNGIGWTTVCSDGQECCYNKTKPMSAFRVALIPKTEKKYVIDTWNKVVGTYNIDQP